MFMTVLDHIFRLSSVVFQHFIMSSRDAFLSVVPLKLLVLANKML